MAIASYFCLLVFVVEMAASCSSFMDCPTCHRCTDEGACVIVLPFTDPNGECPVYCEVKTVCNFQQICVYDERPSCNCEWLTGECLRENRTSVQTRVVRTEELVDRGYSDDDIRMIVEIINQEHKHHERNSSLAEPRREHSIDIIAIYTTNLIMLVCVFFMFLSVRKLVYSLNAQVLAKAE